MRISFLVRFERLFQFGLFRGRKQLARSFEIDGKKAAVKGGFGHAQFAGEFFLSFVSDVFHFGGDDERVSNRNPFSGQL